ncbi:MAG TPA: aspartate aminotransferase family protein [bacterium]|jgi:acetylornithine/N-succinyldiaminopimelate aminotransferase|nr:aspartate aminotransferase family protein [bacterium]
MDKSGVAAREHKSLLQTFSRLPVALARGKGAMLWDEDGKRYLDFVSGISVTNLGHAHPALTKAITGQVARLSHVSNLVYQRPQVDLAEALRKAAPFATRVAFANSGSEANELLIKFARRFGAAQGRFEILAFHGAFHGRTFGSLSASGQAKLHKGLDPLLPGFRHVAYNDLDAARRAVNRRSAAILVEPIQGENGVIEGTDEFLVGLRRLADRHGLLLMLDEIQTGLGRTGDLFAYQDLGHDCVPDLMSLAKSLGGGLPLSAVLVGEKAAPAIGLGEHGSTLGGNPVACAAGLALLKEVRSAKLAANVTKVGAFMLAEMKAWQEEFPAFVRDARGRGLMLGLELSVPAKPLMLACLEKGLMVNATADTVLRLLPPLNLSLAEAKQGLAVLKTVVGEAASRSLASAPHPNPRKAS